MENLSAPHHNKERGLGRGKVSALHFFGRNCWWNSRTRAHSHELMMYLHEALHRRNPARDIMFSRGTEQWHRSDITSIRSIHWLFVCCYRNRRRHCSVCVCVRVRPWAQSLDPEQTCSKNKVRRRSEHALRKLVEDSLREPRSCGNIFPLHSLWCSSAAHTLRSQKHLTYILVKTAQQIHTLSSLGCDVTADWLR